MKSKNVISASILIDDSDKTSKVLSKNFGKNEIANIRVFDKYMYFDIKNPLSYPVLLSMFPTLQFYINGTEVNMKMLKA